MHVKCADGTWWYADNWGIGGRRRTNIYISTEIRLAVAKRWTALTSATSSSRYTKRKYIKWEYIKWEYNKKETVGKINERWAVTAEISDTSTNGYALSLMFHSIPQPKWKTENLLHIKSFWMTYNQTIFKCKYVTQESSLRREQSLKW